METKYSDSSLNGKPLSENTQMSRPNEQINGREEPATELKAEHSIVLRTLKAANIASRRVVSNQEIVRALSGNEITQIKDGYHQDISTVIGKILTLLQARGLVFSPGKIGNNRYYGATAILDPETTSLPDKRTRRGCVMELVRGAVEYLGRAVRIGDVLRYASGRPEARGLDASAITLSVLSLLHTKDLQVVGVIRGEEKGNNLYLPSGLDPTLYKPAGPLTWLEEVACAFDEVWNEHVKRAEEDNRLPRPVSTGEVRAKWASSPTADPKSRESQPVVNAMATLARKVRRQSPLIRKIRRKGEKAILWAPSDVPDKGLDIGDAHASDAERIGMAVQRAVEQLGGPVTIRDVADEVDLDPSLRPASSISLFKILSDASKEKVAASKGTRKQRVIRRVYRVGAVENETYYYDRAEGLDEARAYVDMKRFESRWQAIHAEERLRNLAECLIPSVAIGNACLIVTEAQNFDDTLSVFLRTRMDGATRREAESLHTRIEEVVSQCNGQINSRDEAQRQIPLPVSTSIHGWTAEELYTVFHPLHPKLQKGKDHHDLLRLVFNEIRRVPNPDFENRFCKDPRRAAEYLFDRTDALIYAAKRWGGYECRFQAKTARDQLGQLRDVRYVFPALQAEDLRVRLAGVACLAFLWSAEGNEYLREIAVKDREPGVRQSALWAYGFAGGNNVHDLLLEINENDANAHVRRFAKTAMSLSEKGWWVF